MFITIKYILQYKFIHTMNFPIATKGIDWVGIEPTISALLGIALFIVIDLSKITIVFNFVTLI